MKIALIKWKLYWRW